MLRVALGVLLAVCAGCSSSGSDGAGRKPAGTLNDPVDVCERAGDVCRLDGSRLGVCNQPMAGASSEACAGRTPCLVCTSQH